MKYTKLQYFFIMFLSIFTFGQVNIIADTDKKTIGLREQFILTVIQETNGNEYIQETPVRLPDLSKFNILGQGSVRQTYGDPTTKTVINQLVYEFVLEPKQLGRIKIGSFLVTVNGVIYKSEPFDVWVKDGDFGAKPLAENPAENVYLNMELQEKEVYKNQPTVAIIRAYSKNFNSLRRVGKVSFPENDNVQIKPISFAKSEIEQKANISSQVVGVVLIFPNETGNINVPRASVSFADENRKVDNIKSNPVKLNVKSLPTGSPKNFKNAVGDFDIKIINASETKQLEVDKPIDILVKIKGKGNLNENLLPKILASKDYTFYKPDISNKIKKDGLKGEIEARYVIVPKKNGEITVKTEGFAYFNPEQKKYVDLGAKTLVLNVMTTEQISDAKTTLEKVNEYTNTVLESVNTPIIETKQYKIVEKEKLNWKALFTNYSLILVFFIFLIIVISVWRKMNNQKPKTENLSLGSVAETEEKIKNTLPLVDVESSLLFMENKIAQADFDGFFNAFEELNTSLEKQVSQKYNSDLKTYLQNHKGEKIAEDYRNIVEQIRVEKYAPVHSQEYILELFSKVKKKFPDIA
ncbi:MAG: BatD family protein [Cruoricaptor ignavus]|nr:BatD family protein [Cruoricaptor ignavus]